MPGQLVRLRIGIPSDLASAKLTPRPSTSHAHHRHRDAKRSIQSHHGADDVKPPHGDILRCTSETGWIDNEHGALLSSTSCAFRRSERCEDDHTWTHELAM